MAVATVLDREVFRKTCARFTTGIAVATVSGTDGAPYGITVNSFTSVSAAPPLVLVCIDYRSSVLTHFRGSAWYAINVLSDAQQELSERFAARVPDRFHNLGWRGANRAFLCSITASPTWNVRSSKPSKPATTRSSSQR